MTYLQPLLPTIIVLIALGLMRPGSPRWLRIGRIALAGLFLLSWHPVAALLNLTLEWPYPVTMPPPEAVGGIVVLSGGVYRTNPAPRDPAPSLDTYLRCQYAAWLYRHWRNVPVFASGGKDPEGVILSEVMQRILEGEGVPSSEIIAESESTSTYTNAVKTAAILRARGIRKVALVTEAFHMWRSEMCFRKQGIDVVAAPMAFRGKVFGARLGDFIPSPVALHWNEDILHEWVGLTWYTMSGKT